LLFFVTALVGECLSWRGIHTVNHDSATIMRTTEEALKAVPNSYREGSYGLGAGKLRTVFKIVLPSAMPGILAGVILGIGRIVGESAALIYTAGTVAEIPKGSDFLFDFYPNIIGSYVRTYQRRLYVDQSYATAVILFIIVVLINCLAGFISKKLSKV